MSEANAPGGARPLGETIAREGAEDRSREPGDLPPTARPIMPSWKGVALTMTYRIPVLAAVAMTVLAAPIAHAAPVTVQLRVEGPTRTLFEGPVTTDVRTFHFTGDATQHTCDGTKSGNGGDSPN